MTKKKPATRKKPAAKKKATRKRAPTVAQIARKAGVRPEDAKAILDNGNPAAYSTAMVSLVFGARDELSK